MTSRAAQTSPLVYARVAGLAYVIIIMLGIFSVSFIESNLVVPGDDAATVRTARPCSEGGNQGVCQCLTGFATSTTELRPVRLRYRSTFASS